MADSLREILAPPIAAIISFIDVRSNLNTLLEPEGVLTDIWLRIFKSSIKAIKQVCSKVPLVITTCLSFSQLNWSCS